MNVTNEKTATTSKSLAGKMFASKTSKSNTTASPANGEVDIEHPAVVTSVPQAEKFVYMEGLKKALGLAYLTGENLILFGKGGFGKSEMTEHFFESRGITPFVKTMGSGTTTDSLFGGIDIKTFNETGKIEYLVENSFMNQEYVVFEELFDAPDYILEQLKDILTSKKFRNGTQEFPIKTKLIVCCTNKTREEFSKNDSLKALMERFPLEFKVEWSAYNRETYNYMFQAMFGKGYPQLAFLLEKLHVAGTTVSPRTAIKAARILEQCKGDVKCLEFIADFSGKNHKLVQTELGKFAAVKVIEDLYSVIKDLQNKCAKITLTTLSDIKDAKTILKDMTVEISKLKSKKLDDDMMKEIKGRIESFEKFVIEKSKEIVNATEA